MSIGYKAEIEQAVEQEFGFNDDDDFYWTEILIDYDNILNQLIYLLTIPELLSYHFTFCLQYIFYPLKSNINRQNNIDYLFLIEKHGVLGFWGFGVLGLGFRV